MNIEYLNVAKHGPLQLGSAAQHGEALVGNWAREEAPPPLSLWALTLVSTHTIMWTGVWNRTRWSVGKHGWSPTTCYLNIGSG